MCSATALISRERFIYPLIQVFAFWILFCVSKPWSQGKSSFLLEYISSICLLNTVLQCALSQLFSQGKGSFLLDYKYLLAEYCPVCPVTAFITRERFVSPRIQVFACWILPCAFCHSFDLISRERLISVCPVIVFPLKGKVCPLLEYAYLLAEYRPVCHIPWEISRWLSHVFVWLLVLFSVWTKITAFTCTTHLKAINLSAC